MNIPEMLQKRAKAVVEARAFLDAAEKEKRALTAEEQNSYDTAFNEANRISETIQRAEQQAAIEASLANSQQNEGRGDEGAARYEFRSRSLKGLGAADLAGMSRLATPAYSAAFRSWVRYAETNAERRALQADLDTAGGNLYASEERQA